MNRSSSFPITSHAHSHARELSDFKRLVENRIREIVTQQKQNFRLHEALEYVTQPGGKLIRPQLVYEFATLVCQGEDVATIFPAIIDCAVAIELIHTYSLIHDDLPSMDNAMLRRGRQTCWATYDEATAILVGDALIPLAFEILSELPGVSDSQKISLIRLISNVIGPGGLVAGQMMDLYPEIYASESQDKMIELMQVLKTGVLLGAACGAGVILGKREDLREGALHFGEQLGLLYQFTDDLLDVKGTQDVVGKTVNNDQNKMTFISIYGIEQVQEMIKEISEYLKGLIDRDFKGQSSLYDLVSQIAKRQS